MKRLKSILSTRFNQLTIVQVLLIGVTPVLFWLLEDNPVFKVTRITLVLVWLAQLFILSKFLLSREDKLIDAIKVLRSETGYHNVSRLFSKYINPEFADEIGKLIEAFRKLRLDREKDLFFFQNTLENLPIGILAYNHEGRIRIANRELAKLLGLKGQEDFYSISRQSDKFSALLNEITKSETSSNKVVIDGEAKHLFSKNSTLNIENEIFTIISLQDINREVHRLENETLRKLVRILSHEMINSLNPITFLSSGLAKTIESEMENNTPVSDSVKDELISGLQAINKRSKGLTEFISAYKKLIHIPEPIWEEVNLNSLIKQVTLLHSSDFEKKKIVLSIEECADEIFIESDEKLLAQVLINLVKNAIQALEQIESPRIEISMINNPNSVYLRITDNGPGIPEEYLTEVFSSFFTTKETGSGLGLTFSKQVMDLLGGDISVTSKTGMTIFQLTLNKTCEIPA